ncbi:MAG TPA: preprotein translocase subunit YajC [Verrucomicrobiae bacterium]|nr:preprotein translocase subunit YajC [Verrucomicrobiae bacterium]
MLGLAFAMGTPPGGAGGAAPSALMQFAPIIVMFGIFYFLLIRPQQKKAREHRALIDSLKKGDMVVTAAGIHGKVVSVDENSALLEIAPGVNVRFTKGYIASLENKG